ncbi:MAG: precorrin-6A reductase [Desulfotomaculaceae bacterium]|nr:precorrin-6A reductase [Desulfotomaculaceae bacterium]MDD4767339.1 precorrin-6A reductase [Desulfotomaculaceae bacterium]
MVLLLSGAGEGREITARLSREGYKLITIASTEPEHGCRQALHDGSREAVTGELGRKELADLLEQKAIKAVVDLSCPFPGMTSKLLKEVCGRRGILRLCYMPEEIGLAGKTLIYPVFSWAEAAHKASGLGNTIFLTTGSNNLEVFLDSIKDRTLRIVVRILPEYKVVKKCQELGLSPRDIVAMQGPFSKEMNRATFKSYKASVVVTRDSGKAGGIDTKISAALSLNIPVVIIKRDRAGDGIIVRTYDEVVKKLESVL